MATLAAPQPTKVMLASESGRPTTLRALIRPARVTQPGRPLFYATAMALAGSGVGLLVESHQGRPTKIEGNPDHPASRGGSPTSSIRRRS